jgi:type III secretory pathway component EscT
VSAAWGWLASLAVEVGLHALRLLPAAALSPLVGGPLVPPLVRAALALALGAAAHAASGGAAAPPATGAGLAATAARELGLGAVLAVLASLPVDAARAAGRLVDTLRGATLAELHVAPVRQQETAVGDLLVQWSLALAAWSGGGRMVMAALLDTFRTVPLGVPVHGDALLGVSLAAASELASAAFCMGAPAAAGVLSAELALGAAARLAPRTAPGGAAPAVRATLGLAAVALPSAAIGGRLVELAALSAGLVGRLGGGP